MGDAVLSGWSRFFLLIGILAGICSLGGGGTTVPPFKSFSWLTTSTTNVGIYGACKNDKINPYFFSIDKDYAQIQKQECSTVFDSGLKNVGPVGRLLPKDEVMVSGLFALGLVFSLISLVLLRRRNPLPATVFAFAGSLLEAVAFGLGTWLFYRNWTDLASGYDDRLGSVSADSNVRYGLGMYFGGASCLLLFTASSLSWSAIKDRRSEKFGSWDV
ncbi:hypothetical protein HK103_007530 [Boothiomyces macroporosus]|uniref:Uncharacterized protein n=1 Tax=Boothiomyces macroporosus TaxID=261099 RepID=A0AAD5UCD0_9FUNG|nr:hypothetical protein HK103_007530 [Boothiomyces macroporosus]